MSQSTTFRTRNSSFVARRRAGVLAGVVALAVVLQAQSAPSVRLTDVTTAVGINFTHNNGAFGKKYLPETLGAGAAFFDFDNDGRQDLFLVNGTNWPGQPPAGSRSKLYRNAGTGVFVDVTERAGLAMDLYGMGVAVADFDNDGWQDCWSRRWARIACFATAARAPSWT